MAWSDKLKLSKQLIRSLNDTGYHTPKELQQRILPRIIGGQDVIAIAPEGSGKTTAYVLAVLNRVKYNAEGVPLVLILVPDQERVFEVISTFERFNKNESLSVVGLYAAPGIEAQMNALTDGADIVVATPDRARAIYLKLGLNLNKISLFIVDDAEQIVKQGLQLPVAELANSITKAQHLVFTTVMHPKLDNMIAPFMKLPAVIEIDEIAKQQIETKDQVLYHVPNFGTKLNLLQLFMQDDELFTKVIVFVNTRPTAEKLYKNLQNRLRNGVALLNSWFIELKSFKSVSEFMDTEDVRVLIALNNADESISIEGLPFILNFELPVDNDLFINRITQSDIVPDDDSMVITFATDLELANVKQIEQVIGQRIPVGDLPDDLVIEKEKAKTVEKESSKKKDNEPVVGQAFHEKKAANAKTYNFSSSKKAKMNKKKNH